MVISLVHRASILIAWLPGKKPWRIWVNVSLESSKNQYYFHKTTKSIYVLYIMTSNAQCRNDKGGIYKEYCMCLSDKLFQHSQEGCFCMYFSGNKYQNNTRVSAETVCHESTHITLFLTWHNESKNDDKNDDLYTSSPCLSRFSFCWWRHNDQTIVTWSRE